MKFKIKYYTILLIIISLFGCKNDHKVDKTTLNSNLSINNKDISFDSVLQCSDYTYDEGFFITADYGCIFNPKEKNDLGNLIIYLIPNEKLNIDDNNLSSETERINNLSINEYKKKFSIYIYLIEKDFLNYNQTADPIYYQKDEYIENLYTYENNEWIFVDKIKISKNINSSSEQSWREKFINDKVNNVKSYNNDKVNSNQSSFRLPVDFYIHDSINLNLKNKNYKIVALEKNINKNNSGNWYFQLPIIILEKRIDKYYKILENNNLLFKFEDNCPAEGYGSLVVKNNYFTIQQSSCRFSIC